MPKLSQYELTVIAENLEREQALSERCKLYAASCEDPQLQIQFSQLAARHMNHYGLLLEQLE